jgi:hypothetical protein
MRGQQTAMQQQPSPHTKSSFLLRSSILCFRAISASVHLWSWTCAMLQSWLWATRENVLTDDDGLRKLTQRNQQASKDMYLPNKSYWILLDSPLVSQGIIKLFIGNLHWRDIQQYQYKCSSAAACQWKLKGHRGGGEGWPQMINEHLSGTAANSADLI